MSETTKPTAIDPAVTVNEIVDRHPETLGVLNARGIDTCCGGSLPLSVAAERHGIDESELLEALEAALSASAR